jgi:hypothetical protein
MAAGEQQMEVHWNGALVKTVGPFSGGSKNLWHSFSIDVQAKHVFGPSFSDRVPNELKFVSAGTNPAGDGVGAELDGVRVERLAVEAISSGGDGSSSGAVARIAGIRASASNPC